MTRLRDKESILKATREKQLVTYKGALIRLSSDFSTEAFQARRDWHEIFKVMKSKDLQLRLSFKIEGEIRSFLDKKNIRSLLTPNQYCNKC